MAKPLTHLFPYPVRILLAVTLGLVVWRLVSAAVAPGALAAAKLRGRSDCTWASIAEVGAQYDALEVAEKAVERQVSIRAIDGENGLLFLHTGARSFWIKATGEVQDGKSLLLYLLAEHEWMARLSSDLHVRPGDVVLDCGAHVGVFTSKALERGASKVVAIEPEPKNVICLNRNFEKEIAAGKVVVYPKGVWNSETTLSLNVASTNSGSNSVVLPSGTSTVQIPVTTIDKIVEELKLPRVNFIKMDIEGAEREALRGATRTLQTSRPRMMLDAYHLPDDMQVLPVLAKAAVPDYRLECGPCEPGNGGRWKPHAIFFTVP